ncbi:MAG: hypothetical protein OJF58_000111 [Enhydrobacter sp.]|jgi:hypothetical protein|nr:MAG: hypothetical protein OJF58_000111 [Enhydrobacter sp.]
MTAVVAVARIVRIEALIPTSLATGVVTTPKFAHTDNSF